MKFVFALCGSFCTHRYALEALRAVAPGNEVIPSLSDAAASTDTRFGAADTLRESLRLITGNDPILTVKQAESIVTGGGFDAVIVAPCTGNTLAKLANGITDNAVTMCVKAQLRNGKPVVIAPATNDGLGASLVNIARLLERKQVYFVPFGQDSPDGKPNSLVCDFSLVPRTAELAIEGKQIQPILL